MTALEPDRRVGEQALREPGVLAGAVARLRYSVPFLGPAFVAGIAYVDPGNVVTNVAAGSAFGYGLLWVVVAANLVAALVQALSAKLGLATGHGLAEVTRDRYGRPAVLVLWLQAELMALATDLAEVVGGAIALQLLFGLPAALGAIVTAVAAFALLGLRNRGHRPFELAVFGLFTIIAAAFVYDLVASRPQASGVAGGLLPTLPGPGAALLAIAIVGATVMPHAVYLHSALATPRTPRGAEISHRQALSFQRVDIGIAMGTAGVVNAAMLVAAAALGIGATGVGGDLGRYHETLIRTIGGGGAFVFVVALLASGLASSGVGTLAGEVIMAGFLRRHVPRAVRRAATLAPAVVLLGCGVPGDAALVASQVVLGVGVPVALVLLIRATSDRSLMGALVNRTVTTVLAVCCTVAIAMLSVVSLLATVA